MTTPQATSQATFQSTFQATPQATPQAASQAASRDKGDKNGSAVLFTIRVGGETFALPIDAVRTVFRATRTTPVPFAPPAVVGLTNVRGRIVTAVSLHAFFDMPRPESRTLLTVGVEYEGEDFALVVDQVGDVIEVNPSNRLPLPGAVATHRRAVTAAIYRIGDTLVPMLDLPVIFNNIAAAAAA